VSWADGEISVTLNQGTLTGEAFGFVVSHAGDINELGLMGTWGD
jgi:hypothetical protein